MIKKRKRRRIRQAFTTTCHTLQVKHLLSGQKESLKRIVFSASAAAHHQKDPIGQVTVSAGDTEQALAFIPLGKSKPFSIYPFTRLVLDEDRHTRPGNEQTVRQAWVFLSLHSPGLPVFPPRIAELSVEQ